MKEKEDFLEENFYSDEISTTRTPANNEGETLKERLNPEKEIKAFKLALMGAYEVEKKITDNDTGEEKTVVVLKRMKNFKPILNKQGIEEVTDYLKNLVNPHTFQSNFIGKEDYNASCKFTFNMMAANFIGKRREWAVADEEKVSILNLRFVYIKAKNIAKLGLRRALNDAERTHLGETVKETIQTNKTPLVKENILQKAAGILR